MDKASAYGAGDCRFESCQDHLVIDPSHSRPPPLRVDLSPLHYKEPRPRCAPLLRAPAASNEVRVWLPPECRQRWLRCSWG